MFIRELERQGKQKRFCCSHACDEIPLIHDFGNLTTRVDDLKHKLIKNNKEMWKIKEHMQELRSLVELHYISQGT